MGFVRPYLRIVGVFIALAGLGYAIAPVAFTDAAGFGHILAGGVTDVRATYGGLQLGLGAFLIWAASEQVRAQAALYLLVFSVPTVGVLRALGILIDGVPSAFHFGGLFFEVSLTLLTLYGIARLRRVPLAV
jgi:hypothetical protein